MTSNSLQELIKDRLSTLSGNDFQSYVWKIFKCHYPDLNTPEMNHDLGNDGYSIAAKLFFAVYAPPSRRYDNTTTIKKISNPSPKKGEEIGDYEKFLSNWKPKYPFTTWVFVTGGNLLGKAHQKLVELNNNGDGIKKENWVLDDIVRLSLNLTNADRSRIFNLPEENAQPTEVETIMDLICYITENTELTKNCFDNDLPDPGKKLERFAQYCKEIKKEIGNSIIYANAQQIAEQAVSLDKINIEKKVIFLKQISRRFLRENKDNPMVALDKLTDYFEERLSKTNKHYSNTAIRYYLIGEIPKCNIFPNENE